MLFMPCEVFADTVNVPINLTVSEKPLEFEVTENIQMTATKGKSVISISPLTITNTGSEAIMVAELQITTESGWTLTMADTDFTTEESKEKLSFTCEAYDLATGTYEPARKIRAGNNTTLEIKGKISEKADLTTDFHVTNAVVTVERYDAMPYLEFSGNEEFTLKTGNATANWDGTMEYSTDATTWNTWDGTEITSSGNILYLRGNGNTTLNGTTSTDRNFVFTGSSSLKIYSKGNIENLLDYQAVESGEHPVMSICCFSALFYECSALVTAPELPATTLTERCYYKMFHGCTSLTTAPTLPTTTLAKRCYYKMFRGCTSLTTAPALPATTLTSQCYYETFYGCTSLTTAPSLPATTLSFNCYYQMFNGCTALTTLPELSATTLDEESCYRMFGDCNLIKLSTTQTGEYQTAYRIPTTGTGTTATNALKNMFAGTGGTFTGTPDINTTYYTSNAVV